MRRAAVKAIRAGKPSSIATHRQHTAQLPVQAILFQRRHSAGKPQAPQPAKARSYASDAGFPQPPPVIAQQAQMAMSQGLALLAQGDAPAASELLARALELRPTADAHYNMGVCQLMLKNTDRARAHWLSSIQLDPTQADAFVSLGNVCFMDQKDSKRAIAYMRKALELAPRDPEIMFNLATMLESTGELAEAVEMYDRAVSHGLEKAQPFLRNAIAKRMNPKHK
ncbi:hypothetical protein H4S02_000083 [Coemansia sp. RSA 2611]|nr:hypothetical protein H4S01_000286 [Coemansia sp. RSA 2610]KAJ2393619.1 hypothetical protein H4S02_000083 [Coemansia sp. RSA 2611]